MSGGVTRVLTRIAAVGVVLIGALAALACGASPNEHVESNEFFRPSAATAEPSAAADSAEQSGQSPQSEQAGAQEQESAPGAGSEAAEQSGQSGQSEQAQESEQAADAEEDEPGQQEEADAQEADEQEQQASDDAPLETSDDVVRRYSSPAYGYSLELVCSPFCETDRGDGVDRVSFLSETGRALIGVDVFLDDGSEAGAFLRSVLALSENQEFASREAATIVTGEAAERFNWEEDRRATGGFQVRWSALFVRVQELVIVVRAGAVLDDYEAVSPALERALGSFILPLEITARPGRYARFDFVIDYDPADFAQEYGQPAGSPVSADAGILVLSQATALKAVLTWQVLGEAFYDGDAAIGQSLRDSLGEEVAGQLSGLRDWNAVDGRPARTGESETPFGEGVLKIQSFAWYCQASGREFALHVLDADDPEAVALPLIESFRCSVEE